VILIEASHWPLVVVGDALRQVGLRDQRLALERWHSRDLRLVTLVVPGSGTDAFESHDRLVRWLGEQMLTVASYCCGMAWVIPDAAVRGYVSSILASHDHFAFGCPSAVFSNIGDAFNWLTRTAACDGCRWRGICSIEDAS
jgi:hypothetical protein